MKNIYSQKAGAFIFFCSLFLFSFNGFAQVGIGTTNPNSNAKLDIVSTVAEPGGLLLPRVALTATDNFAPLTAHEAGMTVYNTATTTGVNMVTPGYYYNDGGQWVRIAAASVPSSDWTVAGNAGLNATNNFLGTTDAVNLRFRTTNIDAFEISSGDATARGKLRAMTNGTAALPVYSFTNSATTGIFSPGANTLAFSTTGAERMRVLSDGRITINSTGAYSFMLNSSAAGTTGGIIGASTNGTAVQGQTSGTGDAMVGIAVGTGDGVVGVSGSGIGVYARSENPNEMGLLSAGNNVNGVAGGPIGLGGTLSGSDYGGGGFGRNSAGTGMIGVGNNGLTINTLAEGSGVAGTGNKVGVYGYAVNGEIGNSNDGNSGGYFALGSNSIPNSQVRAYAKIAGYHRGPVPINPGGSQGNNNTNSYYGGFFAGGVGTLITNPSYAYVGIKYNTNESGQGGTNYKIIGNGTVSTLVDDSEGNKRILFASEAPEILFEDYGVGQLKNGSIYIEIDPLFAKSIFVSEKHPLKVFIQLEGECNGVYVTEKTAKGFYVKELNGGASNTPFSYHLVANRADDIARDGSVVSKHVGLRFPIGPGPLEMAKMKTVEVKEASSKTVIKKKNIDSVVNYQAGIHTIEENTSYYLETQETPVKSTETEKNRFQMGN